MRIIFIPGLGEDEFIFDMIKDRLPGKKLFLSLWKELPPGHDPGINVMDLACSLVLRYGITAKDIVIGHSAGGWVALHIKQVAGSAIIQLASWTDPKKIMVPAVPRQLIYFAARTGIYLNRLVMRRSLRMYYEGKPSRDIFERVSLRLLSGNRANVVNQLRIIFNPVVQPATVSPDLRIHAKADRVIRFPDGPVDEVPGDHFSLYTYPEQVLAPVLQFMGQHDLS